MPTATRSKTITPIPSAYNKAWTVVWTGLDGDDNGEALEMPDFSNRSVQFTGTFDSATIVLQGSNDGSNWVTLQDLEGAAISMTSAGLVSIMEDTRYIRPSVSGGGGSTSLTATVLIAGAN